MKNSEGSVTQLISRLVKTGICNAIGDGISISDTDFRILYQNTAHINTFGNHPGEFCFNAYAGLDQVCEHCPLVQVFNDNTIHKAEWCIPSKTKRFSYEITASPLKDEAGKTVAGIEVIRDITKRKEIEETLKDNEKRYRLLLDVAFDGIAVTEHGKFLEASEKFARIFGYDPDDIVGDNISLLSAPECLDDAMKKIMSGYDKPYETVGIKKDGTRFPMEVCGKSFLHKNRTFRITAIRDISERKHAEEALRKSESKLAESQHIAHIGSWEYNIADDELWWSDETYNIFRIDPEKEKITFLKFTSLIHHDDREILKDQVRSGLPYRLDYRILLPGGQIRHVHEEVRMRRGKDGLPERIWGTVQDITSRKQMEEKFQEAAITDDLTGLFNRRGFLTLAEKQCKMADRSKKRLSLLYVDLDGMKSINDEFGHKAGDQALIDTADILKKTFRESDIIGRMGGDEFAVLLSEHSKFDIEHIITNHIQKNLEAHNNEAGRDYRLMISIGLSHLDRDHPCSIDELISTADKMMYKDKRLHKKDKKKKEKGF